MALGSACRVTVAVGVDAEADGSGAVRAAVGLDRQALREVPDLAQQLRVDDLRRAGWKVTGPRQERGEVTWIRAEKRFSSPARAEQAAAQLNDPDGPFRRFRLTRDRSLLRTTTRFQGTVDLTRGLESFEDAELRRRLAGAELGLGTGDLERRLDVAPDRTFELMVDAELPGTVTSNAPMEREGTVQWRPRLGERMTLTATGQTWNSRTIVFGGMALVAGAGAVVAFRRRTPDVSPSP